MLPFARDSILVALRKPPRTDNDDSANPRWGNSIDPPTLVRALLLSAAFAGSLTPIRCLGEDGHQPPTKATRELSPEVLSLLQQKKHAETFTDRCARFQGRIGALSSGSRTPAAVSNFSRSIRSAARPAISDPRSTKATVRPPRPSTPLRPRADESELQLLPRDQYRLPQRLRPGQRPRRHFSMIHGDCSSSGCYATTDEQIGEDLALARSSFLGSRQSVPDPRLSVPHDAGEPRAAPHHVRTWPSGNDQGR